MVRTEIGSEFWETSFGRDMPNAFWEAWDGCERAYLSGRTALSAVLDDILIQRRCKTAYLPSYCCHTMIEPFLAHGISVEFYPVVFEDGQLVQEIDPANACDVVLVMDYFGFAGQEQVLPENAVVLRDMTHALFAAPQEADYLFASFRKWGAVAGAAIACKAGQWLAATPTGTNNAYLALRREGYARKRRFMAGEGEDKQAFLKLFSEAEELLEKNYHGYAADEQAITVAAQLQGCINARRTNAQYLLDGLRNVAFIQPIFPALTDTDVPLFVPIFVKAGQRDALRKYLIDRDIYCPIHWPASKMHRLNDREMALYDAELSLVCDQRYETDDMQRIIDTISEFYRR